MSKRPQINIRIPEETKSVLEAWAVEEGRTLSNLVNFIIAEALKVKKSASL